MLLKIFQVEEKEALRVWMETRLASLIEFKGGAAKATELTSVIFKEVVEVDDEETGNETGAGNDINDNANANVKGVSMNAVDAEFVKAFI